MENRVLPLHNPYDSDADFWGDTLLPVPSTTSKKKQDAVAAYEKKQHQKIRANIAKEKWEKLQVLHYKRKIQQLKVKSAQKKLLHELELKKLQMECEMLETERIHYEKLRKLELEIIKKKQTNES